MHWEGKHTPILEVTTPAIAVEYARRTRRIAFGVTAALCPRGAEKGNPGTKVGTGAEKYASYTSPLGEKHHVKD